MSESLDKALSGPAGEHLVLGELLKRGHAAFLALGKTQSDWDIIIMRDTGDKLVQVKAVDWPCSKNHAAKFSHKPPFYFDYLVIVLLRRDMERSQFFLFTKDKAESLVAGKEEKTITISGTMLKREAVHEDNWAILQS